MLYLKYSFHMISLIFSISPQFVDSDFNLYLHWKDIDIASWIHS